MVTTCCYTGTPMTWPEMQLWEGSVRAGGGPGVRGMDTKRAPGRRGPSCKQETLSELPLCSSKHLLSSFWLLLPGPHCLPWNCSEAPAYSKCLRNIWCELRPCPCELSRGAPCLESCRHRDRRLSLALQVAESSWGTRHVYSPRPKTWLESG